MKCAVKVDLSVIWPHFLGLCRDRDGAVLLVFPQNHGKPMV